MKENVRYFLNLGVYILSFFKFLKLTAIIFEKKLWSVIPEENAGQLLKYVV